MAELQPPQIDGLGSFMQGRQAGREVKRQRTLAEFVSPAAQGDKSALASIYSVDMDAGEKVRKHVGELKEDARQQLIEQAKWFTALPEDQRAQAYARLVQTAHEAGMDYIPTDYDPKFLPGLQRLAGAGGQGNVQSTYIDAQGNRVAIMRDGTTQVLGQNAPSNQIIDTGNGFYGVNRGNLQAAPVMIGQPPQQQSQPRAPGEVPFTIDPSLPPQVQAAIRADEGKWAQAPEGANMMGPQAGTQLRSTPKQPNPLEVERLRLAQEANARAAQAAQLAQRGNAPAGFRFKPDGSLEPIPGGPKPAGAAASEDERKAAAWLAQAGNAYENMKSALAEDPDADDPGLIETYSPIEELGNRSRSATRQKYMQAASSISEALLRAATGAGINEHEAAQKVKELTPQRGDSAAVKAQKMKAIPVYLAALKARAGRAASQVPQQPSAPQQFGGFRVLED